MRLSWVLFSHSGRFIPTETYFGNCLLGGEAGNQKHAWKRRRRKNQVPLPEI